MNETGIKPRQRAEGRGERQSWTTPEKLYREIERRYSGGGFTLDAACTRANCKAPDGIYHDEGRDAFDELWSGRVWVNPPYDNIGRWVSKAVDAVTIGGCERVVMLLPARTDQGWFHQWVLGFAQVVWIRGRVAFDPPPGVDARASAFEASMVVIFDQPLQGRMP